MLMSPHAARRAGQKDVVRDSCSKELRPLNDRFAGFRSVVEVNSVSKLV